MSVGCTMCAPPCTTRCATTRTGPTARMNALASSAILRTADSSVTPDVPMSSIRTSSSRLPLIESMIALLMEELPQLSARTRMVRCASARRRMLPHQGALAEQRLDQVHGELAGLVVHVAGRIELH